MKKIKRYLRVSKTKGKVQWMYWQPKEHRRNLGTLINDIIQMLKIDLWTKYTPALTQAVHTKHSPGMERSKRKMN